MPRTRVTVEPGQHFASVSQRSILWVVRRVFDAGALDPSPHVEIEALGQIGNVRTIAREVLLDPSRYVWVQPTSRDRPLPAGD